MLLFSVYRCFHWLYRSGHRYFVHLGLRCSLPVLGLRCMRFRDDAKPHRNLNNKYACNLASASPCHPPVKRTEPSRFTDRLLSKEHTGSFSSSMWTKPQRAWRLGLQQRLLLTQNLHHPTMTRKPRRICSIMCIVSENCLCIFAMQLKGVDSTQL